MLRFHPEALAELDAAVAYLETEREGFGRLLFESVEQRLARAARFPKIAVPIAGFRAELDVRRLGMRRFRYVVVMATIRGERMVVAVAHTSRRPGYWRTRLR